MRRSTQATLQVFSRRSKKNLLRKKNYSCRTTLKDGENRKRHELRRVATIAKVTIPVQYGRGRDPWRR